jgi:hypothetical protein
MCCGVGGSNEVAHTLHRLGDFGQSVTVVVT